MLKPRSVASKSVASGRWCDDRVEWYPTVSSVEQQILDLRCLADENFGQNHYKGACQINRAADSMEQLLRVYKDKLWADEQAKRRADLDK